MEVSLLTAFLGGALALLSPCGALLLPAFFASVVGRRMRLLPHGGVFYLGLVVTLVPLGLGLGAIGSLLAQHREFLIGATSILLVFLGLAQAAGFGFDMSKVLPGAGSLQERAHRRTGLVRTLLLGAASGVAGFCAGPILGAILTLAAGQGSVGAAGVMMAVYGLGMVVPLLGLAAVWDRMSPRALRLLRGRGFRFMGRDLHTTSVVTGLLVAGVGVLFWVTNGLVTLPPLLPSGVQRTLQSYSGVFATPLVDALVLGGVVVAATVVWIVRRSRKRASNMSDRGDVGTSQGLSSARG